MYLFAVIFKLMALKNRERSSVIGALKAMGPEAIRRFTVKDFPAVVLMDAHGGNLYESGPARYREEENA